MYMYLWVRVPFHSQDAAVVAIQNAHSSPRLSKQQLSNDESTTPEVHIYAEIHVSFQRRTEKKSLSVATDLSHP